MSWRGVFFVLVFVWLITVAGSIRLGESKVRVQSERDSLRARTEELEGAIRQYILAAAERETAVMVCEGELNYWRHPPEDF